MPSYLTGESYAGIYVPTLARRTVEDDKQGFDLKGFVVGDGYLGTETSICGDFSHEGFVDFWYMCSWPGIIKFHYKIVAPSVIMMIHKKLVVCLNIHCVMSVLIATELGFAVFARWNQ